MSKRTFVMKNGKPAIKKEVKQEKFTISSSSDSTEAYQLYLKDLRIMFGEDPCCAFLRKYVPGEFDIAPVPSSLDLNEITDTLVIIAIPEGHVFEHLKSLGETVKLVRITVEPGMPPLARVSLLPEQAEIIRQDNERIEGEER